jgi:hypothetical protein
MRYKKGEATDAQKEKLGEAMLFAGALGVFHITDKINLSDIALAEYLINSKADVGSWWDTRTNRQQLQIAQHLRIPAGFITRLEPNYRAMSAQAQTQLHRSLQERCAAALQLMIDSPSGSAELALNFLQGQAAQVRAEAAA